MIDKKLAVVLMVMLAVGPSSAQQIDKSGLPVLSGAMTITDVVDAALKYSPDVAYKCAALRAANARIGMSKAMTRLQLSATLTGTTGTMLMIVSGPEGVSPQNLQGVPNNPRAVQNFMLMYPLYTGGKLRSRVNSASALAKAATSEVAMSELDVALAAKVYYYMVILAQRYVDSYQKRVDESKERVRIAEESFKVGRIAKYDLLRNQTDLAEAEQVLTNAQKDLQVGVINLKATMGISPESNVSVSGGLDFLETARTLEDLRSVALQQRPEVAAAHARIRAAGATVSVAKGAYKPQIYATAMQDFEATRDNGSSQGYIVGITAAIPILDGGLRTSGVSEAQAMLNQMRADERGVVLNVSKDVDTAFAELGAASRNVELAKAAVAQAEEDYRVIKLRYESGKAVNVEVLDALATLTRSQTNYAQALYEHNVARETLARAIGQK